MRKLFTIVVIPLVIIAIGIGVARALLGLRTSAARTPAGAQAPSVEVVIVTAESARARIDAQGLVIPALEVTISPELSGRITYVSKALIPGGRFTRGQTLARIDNRDYALAIKQQESAVRQAELNLQLEAGRQKIAKREWELLNKGKAGEASPLALRKPHFAAAKWSMDAANSNLERAKLSLERTTLRAPFNAIVLDERLDIGQVVSPQTQAVRLVGTDRLWVRVSMPVDRVATLDVPGVNAEVGSTAHVVQNLGNGATIEREGRVLRLLGELDSRTRTAQLLVSIEAPFDDQNGTTPLLPGAYVDVIVDGKSTSGVYAVPRKAVREGTKVWVVDAQDKLLLRTIEVQWGNADQVYVTGDLEEGDRVVTTGLGLPMVGMPVRVETQE